MQNCIFCKEIEKSYDTNFSKLYPEMKERILYETKNFILMPCLGQLSYGHSMIVPKEHFTSMKNAIRAIGINEIQDILFLYKEHLKKEGYTSFFTYEHGNNSKNERGNLENENNNSCIEHAHLNIIPLFKTASLLNEITENKDIFSDIKQVYSKITLNDSYILYALDDIHYSFKYIGDVIYESQYFRRILANYLNKEEWDWKKYGKQNILIQYINDFRKYYD